MKTLFTVILSLFANHPVYAHFSPWSEHLTCVGQNLKIQITIPANANGITLGAILVLNHQGAEIPAMITVMDAGTLDLERQDGFACALGRNASNITGQCGLVATGNYTSVNCRNEKR